MSRYVKIGGPFEIADDPQFSGMAHQQRVFGDVLEMPDEVAQRAILEGAALLPEAEFAGVGFTAEEIARYPNVHAQAQAPAEWQQKHLQARVLLHNYRESLKAETLKTEALNQESTNAAV